ncbi:hypothetical protein ACN4D9_10485, partial [Corynebacterium macclintockiae]
SEAPGKAAVHCVIVGFDKESQPRPRLWDYPDVKGEPVSVEVGRAVEQTAPPEVTNSKGYVTSGFFHFSIFEVRRLHAWGLRV